MEEINSSDDDDVICIGSPEPKRNSDLLMVDLTEEADSEPETQQPSTVSKEIPPDPDRVFNTVRDILPNVNPEFLRKKLEELVSDADVHEFILHCLEEQNRPKITLPKQPINFLNKPHQHVTKMNVVEKSQVNPEVPVEVGCTPFVVTTNLGFDSHFTPIPTQEHNSNFISHSQEDSSDSGSLSNYIVNPTSFVKTITDTVSNSENTFCNEYSSSAHVSSSGNRIQSPSVSGTVHTSAADEFYALLEELDLVSFQHFESFMPISTLVPPPPQSDEEPYNNFSNSEAAIINETNIDPIPMVSATKSLPSPISETRSCNDELYFNGLWKNKSSFSQVSTTTNIPTPTSAFKVPESVPVPSTSQVVYHEKPQESQIQYIVQQPFTSNILLNPTDVTNLKPYSSSFHGNKIPPKHFTTRTSSVIHTTTSNSEYKKQTSVPLNSIHSVNSSHNNQPHLKTSVSVKTAEYRTKNCVPVNTIHSVNSSHNNHPHLKTTMTVKTAEYKNKHSVPDNIIHSAHSSHNNHPHLNTSAAVKTAQYKNKHSAPVNIIHSAHSAHNNRPHQKTSVAVKTAPLPSPHNRVVENRIEMQTVLVNGKLPSHRAAFKINQIPMQTVVDKIALPASQYNLHIPTPALDPIATTSTHPIPNGIRQMPRPLVPILPKPHPDVPLSQPDIDLINRVHRSLSQHPGTQPVLTRVRKNRQERRKVHYRYDNRLHAARIVNNNDQLQGHNQNRPDGNGKNRPDGKGNITPNEEMFSLLSNILFRADAVNLRKEVAKMKDSDDVDKFLINAFAVEASWDTLKSTNGLQCTTKNSHKSRYKILSKLLPDASPTFLKRELSKITSGESLQSFAEKLSQEQSYPKRKKVSAPDVIVCAQKSNSIYHTLVDMLPNADPDYLFGQSKKLTNEIEVQDFVIKAVEENNYPKKEQFFVRKGFKKLWKKYITNFDIKEFLLIFPNPIRHFYIEKKNSTNPFSIPVKFLQYRYRSKNANIFGVLYKETGFSLVRTCDRLDAHFSHEPKVYRTWDGETIFSTSVLQEIAFIQNRREIAHYMLFKKTAKAEAFQKAKEEGALQECGCCFDEKLLEDMIHCIGGHVFCITCVKRGSDVVIGNGGTSFPCYSDGCKSEFSLSVIQNILSPEVFSRLLIRKQYAEVNAAGIPGLESCSFCEFCSIPPPEDKLFRCLNPTCLKISCRSCKNLDHLPLSCEEYNANKTKHKMQNYVEEKMTEALVRTCWECGAKFVKESGCNLMTCKCGAKMCNVCRQPVKDYKHFHEGRCELYFNTNPSDEQNVLVVGEKAKLEMEAANPGYRFEKDPTHLLNSK